jgi:hypothetical protein
MTTSLPRPVLIALVGAVAVGGFLLLTRKGSNEQSVPPTPAPAEQAAKPQSGTATGTGSAKAPTSTARPRSGASNAQGGTGANKQRTLPAPVKHALDAHKVVVLLFWAQRGSDDRSVKSAVDGLSHEGGKVAVFTDTPTNVARYTRISAAANVTETPTLVVVNRHGQARKATGYLDPETVKQFVVDALHGAP